MRPLLALLAFGLVPSAAAQQVALEVVSPAGACCFSFFAGVGDTDLTGDLDGDGLDELLIGQWDADALSFGEVRVHSTLDGSILHTLQGVRPGDGYGRRVLGVSDLNGDGVGDFAVAAPQLQPGIGSTYVRVHSGFDASVLYELLPVDPAEAFGSALAALGDVDGDGAGDFAVGSPDPSPAWAGGHVRVVSGAGGGTLYEVGSTAPLLQQGAPGLGTSLTTLDDRDGDGVRELVVGNPGGEQVQVLSGATGLLLDSIRQAPVTQGHYFGWDVSGGGDFDLDGVEDLVISAVGEPGPVLTNSFEGSGIFGAVYVFRGSDWTSTLRIEGEGDTSGYGVAVCGDQNADGVPEVVWSTRYQRAGCCIYRPGTTYTSSGVTGDLLTLTPGLPGPPRSVGDFDSDGFEDYVAFGPFNSLGASVTTRLILGGRTLPDFKSCWALAFPGWSSPTACYPFIGLASDPSALDGITVLGGALPPDRRVFMFWGPGAAPKPFLNGMLCSSGPFRRRPVQGGTNWGWPTSSCPSAVFDVLDPTYLAQNGLTPGTSFTAQYYLRPPVGSSAAPEVSGGVTITVWP